MQWSPFYFVFLYIKPLKVIFSELGHFLFFIFPVKGRYKVELDKITKLLTEFCIFQLLLQSIGTYVFMYVCIYISIYAASPENLIRKRGDDHDRQKFPFIPILVFPPILQFSHSHLTLYLELCQHVSLEVITCIHHIHISSGTVKY